MKRSSKVISGLRMRLITMIDPSLEILRLRSRSRRKDSSASTPR